MSYSVIASPRFRKELKSLSKKYPSLRLEYEQLVNALESNPTTGTHIGNNCFKIRLSIASKNKGKSGGARIITYFVASDGTVYLLSIYDKSAQQSISNLEISRLIQEIDNE